ncbi:BRI1 kinase inhibitor 1-like [Olea europaea var. sylvestris]|uniref:BRI1 kinase inhibitor 1-like n=1 Tax=Olea europaea var. sylvestris TaxID=158386 RepID=UPI000C1D8462|nr:BRI1 kinase inhibitor 1-like [Olea europaea var. sylvestris]
MERQNQKIREKDEEKQHPEPCAAAAASPPSASSSPEFSFSISVHPSTAKIPPGKNKSTLPSFAVDLSPADDIFFHGHLLPLHLLSNLPVSPRSSTNSMDRFTLPIKELSKEDERIDHHNFDQSIGFEAKGREKSKSFSLFGLPKWRKGCENREKEEKKTTKLKFELSHVVKRYLRMVRPLFLFRNRRGNTEFGRQPYSLSGNLMFKNKKELRGKRGEFSAPASMRTSPTNSGLLVATGSLTPTSTSDSTMEELQAAIQAAIAHCKKSIAMEDKLNSP